MTTKDQPRRVPIPTPAEFPVEWEQADDAEQTWNRDTHHRPDAIPELEADFWDQSGSGWLYTDKILATEPISHQEYRCINGYLYSYNRPLVAEDQQEAVKERNKAPMAKAIEDMERRWNEEWLPEIQRCLSFWDEFELDQASRSDLDAHLQTTWQYLARLWTIHFAIVNPAYGAMNNLADYYDELFADGEEQADPFAAQRLFQAMPNLTVEMGHALWDLSRQALENPALHQMLRAPGCTLETLRASTQGRDFAAALERYLDQYGHRAPTWTLLHPTWRENPAPVFKNLREYLEPGTRNPRLEAEKLAAERNAAITSTRERLSGYPQPARERFEHVLQLAQMGMTLSEDHGVYIDFAVTARVRYVLLACGRRLVDIGSIAATEDVLFLHYDELRAALVAASPANHRALVNQRRAAFEHFSAITPPDRLGVEPPPEEKKEDQEKDCESEDGILRGTPCAPGTVRGSVRILRSMTDTDAIQPGEIMVATATNPSWTPLFNTIGAIVTQDGGKLSHGAVLAREYRIPAVLGVKDVIHRLSDGQRVEVDGSAGTIRLLD